MKVRLITYILFFTHLSFAQLLDQVQIKLTSDRPFYLSGHEMNLFYQIVNPLNNKTIETNEVIYIVLKNGKSDNILERKVYAQNGHGQLNMSIPSELSSGYYELIAYTNYMRNLGPDSFFRKKIAIYNSEKAHTAPRKEVTTTTFEFYPEGGKLIEGLSSRVVYKHANVCKNKSAALVDNKGKTILDFDVNDDGIGSLFFTPEKKKSYQVRHTCDSIDFKIYDFPNAQSEGFALSMTQRGGKIQVIVRTVGQSLKNEQIKISAFADKTKVYESVGMLNKGALFTEVPTESLPIGLTSFFLSNNQDGILATRSVFISRKNHDTLKIDLPKRKFLTKEKISFAVTNTAEDATVSLYVVPENLEKITGTKTSNDIPFGLKVGMGDVPLSKEDLKQIDNMAILNDEAKNRLPEPLVSQKNYLPEELLYIRGKLSDSTPLPDSTLLSFFIPEVNWVYQVKVDSSGVFEFPILNEFHNKQNIIFHPLSEDHVYVNPTISSSDFLVEPTFNLSDQLPWSEVHNEVQQEYLKQQKVKNVFEFYAKDDAESESQKMSFNMREMFPKEDLTYVLDDYVRFPTMEETIKEVVTGLWVRKKKDKTVLRMFYRNWIKEYSYELAEEYNPTPFVVINGSPSDTKDLLNLDPLHVERIRLINKYSKLVYLIPFGSGGVVIVDLKKDVTGYEGNTPLTFELTGISEPRVKKQALVTSRNIPDMRDILLLQPNLEIKKGEPLEVKFVTSDRPGKYIVVAKSIGVNGQIGYTSEKIEVNYRIVNKEDGSEEH